MTILPNKPCYKQAPIKDKQTLAQTLGLTVPQLEKLAANASKMYRANPQRKKDGSLRMTWDAHSQLKDLQGRINTCFFHQVRFPLYLQGSIRDRSYPRDYVSNARIHAGAHIAVTFDIADFFPSTHRAHVHHIWERFFRFHHEVAEILTNLTTKDGVLPQGARTSSYLANLVFWEREYQLMAYLQKKGWRYSRLMDDITVSKLAPASSSELTDINRKTIGLLQVYDYKLKRPKHKVMPRTQPILVNNLVVNAHAALPKKERQHIRAQQHQTIKGITNPGENTPSLASTRGKLAKLRRLHPLQGLLLSAALETAVTETSKKDK
jgi:hypothetical protein